MCEEFGCLPSAAERELERDPELVFAVIEARSYAKAKRMWDGVTDAKQAAELRAEPIVQLVLETEMALAKEEMDQQAHG